MEALKSVVAEFTLIPVSALDNSRHRDHEDKYRMRLIDLRKLSEGLVELNTFWLDYIQEHLNI